MSVQRRRLHAFKIVLRAESGDGLWDRAGADQSRTGPGAHSALFGAVRSDDAVSAASRLPGPGASVSKSVVFCGAAFVALGYESPAHGRRRLQPLSLLRLCAARGASSRRGHAREAQLMSLLAEAFPQKEHSRRRPHGRGAKRAQES